ncbi:protein C-terminal leucine carboxyl O-methyltransferase [Aureococcus anophagefferens]|nr:protein C-terminal leucine carboxyl O-methyltransferase [Aureococcus anophagefferens]
MELSRSTARAKRSCAEKGYVTDAFAPMFSDDTHTRTDPIMHRGYYARFRGVDVAVRTFLSKFGDSAQLVVLGCGLDSMFWRLHATLDTPPTYFEVDSDVVCAAKRRIVRSHPALLDAAGARGLGALGGLGAPGASASSPTLVLCECVLAYLDPERGDALVAWSRRTFAAACLFVAYDVVAPKTGDAFGRVMLSNFKDRGAPLLGAAESLDAVRGRFGDYEASDVRDMRAVYEALVLRQPAELRRISALEIFDDPDEFNLIMAHYCCALAGDGAAVDVARGLAAQLDAA